MPGRSGRRLRSRSACPGAVRTDTSSDRNSTSALIAPGWSGASRRPIGRSVSVGVQRCPSYVSRVAVRHRAGSAVEPVGGADVVDDDRRIESAEGDRRFDRIDDRRRPSRPARSGAGRRDRRTRPGWRRRRRDRSRPRSATGDARRRGSAVARALDLPGRSTVNSAASGASGSSHTIAEPLAALNAQITTKAISGGASGRRCHRTFDASTVASAAVTASNAATAPIRSGRIGLGHSVDRIRRGPCDDRVDDIGRHPTPVDPHGRRRRRATTAAIATGSCTYQRRDSTGNISRRRARPRRRRACPGRSRRCVRRRAPTAP